MLSLADELSARRAVNHPNYRPALTTVTITAACDICGTDATWRGGQVMANGNTHYIVTCPQCSTS